MLTWIITASPTFNTSKRGAPIWSGKHHRGKFKHATSWLHSNHSFLWLCPQSYLGDPSTTLQSPQASKQASKPQPFLKYSIKIGSRGQKHKLTPIYLLILRSRWMGVQWGIFRRRRLMLIWGILVVWLLILNI